MPEATVAAIVTGDQQEKGEIVLTRRRIKPFQDQWCLPGGHIDRFESARNAVIREVKEETGLDFDAAFFGYFDEVLPKRDIHAVVVVFSGPGCGKLISENDEVSDTGWFSIDDACALPLAFKHNEILQAYAAEIQNSSAHQGDN